MLGQSVDKRVRRGALLLYACALFLLPLWSARAGAASEPPRQNIFRRTGESRLSTQDVSSINFASNMYTDLTIRCWEQPQLHVKWTVEAGANKNSSEGSAASEEPGKTLEKEIKITVERESESINVRAQANISRFSPVTLAVPPSNLKLTMLKDRVTGIMWSLKLTVFVPYGLKLETGKFKGATFVACGESHGGVPAR